MKRYVKIILFGIIIIFVILGGKMLSTEKYKRDTIDEEGPRIEKYLKYNYENFHSVTFENVIINPTGIPHIKGYVNNDPEFRFDAGISRDHFNAGLNWEDMNKKLNRKPEYEEHSKTIEEIEKEEQLEK